MKLLIFTEGTILMHKNATGLSREAIVKQVQKNEESVKDYASYVPIGNSSEKLTNWHHQGANILYLTSRVKPEEVEDIRNVLKIYNFPEGELNFRKDKETHANVAEKIIPDVLIEDDCESIGGIEEMTITHIKSEIRAKIKSISIKEFGGVDFLPDNLSELQLWQSK